MGVEVSPVKISFLSERERAYMDREVRGGRTHWDFMYHHDSANGKSQCLTANISRGVPYNVLVDGGVGIRKLTVRECARLQTIPEEFSFESSSDTQAYKAIGNGWTVSVIAHILSYGLGIQEVEAWNYL
jgi:site-specific DNA-cytosine methylase